MRSHIKETTTHSILRTFKYTAIPKQSTDRSIAKWILGHFPDGVTFLDGDVHGYCPETGTYERWDDSIVGQLLDSVDGKKSKKGGVISSTEHLRKSVTSACVNHARGGSTKKDSAKSSKPGVALKDGFLAYDWRDRQITLRENSPENLCTRYLPWSHDEIKAEKGRPEKFLKMAREILKGRDDADTDAKVAFYCEWIGVALLGQAIPMQKAMVLLGRGNAWKGTGGTGKSQLLKILSGDQSRDIPGLFPKSATTNLTPHDVQDKVMVDDLAGKSLVLNDDCPTEKLAKGSNFKKAITGGGIQVNPKYRDSYSFEPKAAHAYATNGIFPTHHHEVVDRLVILECSQRFREEEGEVMDIGLRVLAEEGPAITAWCLAKGIEAMDRGYTIPETSKVAQAEWLTSSSPFKYWLSEETVQCDIADDRCLALPEIARTYGEWADGYGRPTLAENVVKRNLRDAGAVSVRRRGAAAKRIGKPIATVYGLRLKTAADE